jgi:hypothetical protein
MIINVSSFSHVFGFICILTRRSFWLSNLRTNFYTICKNHFLFHCSLIHMSPFRLIYFIFLINNVGIPVPRLRMLGVVPLLPPHVCIAWCFLKHQGQLYLHPTCKYFLLSFVNKTKLKHEEGSDVTRPSIFLGVNRVYTRLKPHSLSFFLSLLCNILIVPP